MKCASCGKKITNGMTICPYCGESTVGDVFQDDSFGNEPDYSDGGFDQDSAPVMVKKVRKKGSSLNKLPVLIVLGVLLAGVIVGTILLNKGPGEAPLPAFAASTGHMERIDEGRGILLIELLVIPAQGTTRSTLEEILEPLDGALVAYMPEMNQYQVRFNTSSRAELDQRRDTLASAPEIARVDYNLLLSLRGPAAESEMLAVPAGKGEKIGILGDWVPEKADSLKNLYLPSVSLKTEADLAAAAEQNAGFFSDAWRSTIQQLSAGRQVTAASAFYYELKDDGALDAMTTSAALRSQLAALVKTGTPWIAVPLYGAYRNNDELLTQETEQMDILIAALENKTPGFVILVSQSGSDWLPAVLAGSEKANAHMLSVGACGDELRSALNLAGPDLPVYGSVQVLQAADCCAPCGNADSAVILAAASLAEDSTGLNRQDTLERVKAGAFAAAADADGAVRPVLKDAFSTGAAQLPDGCGAAEVQILDEITGLPVEGASVSPVSGGQAAQADQSGRILLLTENGQGSFSVQAAGYTGRDNLTAEGKTVQVFLTPEGGADGTGTVSFSVQDADGQAPAGLTVTMKDAGTGNTVLVKQADYQDTLAVYPGTYEVEFSAYNRTNVTVHCVTVTAGEETVIPPLTISIPSDIPGIVSGLIKDAMTGGPLEGVTLRFIRGIDAREGDPATAEISNQTNGQYSASLPAGEYTMFVSKSGYRTASLTVHSLGEKTVGDQNCTITPLVPEGNVRIVLEWNRKPDDLDSHLFNPDQRIHIYFPDDSKKAKRNGELVANLDVDDVDGEGPETTTILKQLPGKYIFLVHNFTDKDNSSSDTMAASNARVTVYVGNNEPLVFTVPNQPGIVWEVFTLENGVVTPSGRILSPSEWNSLRGQVNYTAN